MTASAADNVREFYERYPYPRPIADLEAYRQLWRSRERRRAAYHLFWPGQSFEETRSILIAGCGTSQAAKHAMRWPEAHVTGIDFSETSVRRTSDLRQKYNLKNLELHCLPLERVSELGLTFDQIVCTGVLHHLADPDAGLRALREVLEPSGAMHLMVYAPYGRAGIYMLQEFCKKLGLQPTDQGIGDLINLLRCLPRGHPLETLLREAPDFREEAALADALLHPRDRAYSVPQFLALIAQAGLTFQRWVYQAPYHVQCGNLAKIPQLARLQSLSSPEQFAAAELFRGTMIRHNAIVCRSDNPAAPLTVDFVGDEWVDYVPIRLPGTVCVEEQERLPIGAAAVLLNRRHTFTDIFLPINPEEKLLFDAIDGNCSIAEIARSEPAGMAPAMHRELVRGFFERLLRYDQVVFDTSRKSSMRADSARATEAAPVP